MFTRRRFLTASAALAAAALAGARRRAFAADVDVAVVGAGGAGIFAARELVALGRSVQIVEARGRVGGRLHTDRSLGAPFDAGAAYIHFAERNPWASLAAELGADAHPGSWGGWSRVFVDGRALDAEAQAKRAAASREMGELVDDRDVEDADLSFAAAVAGASPEARSIARQRAQMAMGEEPERVSVAEWQALWSGGNLVVPEGYGTLAEKAARNLPIRLATAATAIRWDGAGVRVETTSGAISARAAIVTVPVGVLQKGGIAFAPRLPAATLRALDGLAMGALTRIALAIDTARLAPEADSGFSDITGGSAMSVQMRPFGRPLILCNIGGDGARMLTEAGEAAAIDHATARVAAALGAEARAAITGGRLAGWWSDPFARGSYSLAKPGRFAARDQLAKPVGERIWFAGEATAGGASVTAGGAALSGLAAARAIAARLRA
jgi:monoamine oxidase